jgi:hypothetical protein
MSCEAGPPEAIPDRDPRGEDHTRPFLSYTAEDKRVQRTGAHRA